MQIRNLLIQCLWALSMLTLLSLEAGIAQATDNTILGSGAGASLVPDAHRNTLLGLNAGNAITDSDFNTLVGNRAGQSTTGESNTFLGNQAGENTTTGPENTFFGDRAGLFNTIGGFNTYLGNQAGANNQMGYGNVFVGYGAGFNEFGSNKLYIDNSGTLQPLIYGEFDPPAFGNTGLVGINGALGVGTQIPMDQLHVYNGHLRIEQTGATHATLNFIANGKTWEIKNNQATGRLTFFSPGGGATTASFKFDRQAVENLLRVGVLAGNTVDINGNLVVTGTITPDYVFTPEYDLESIEDHAAYMWEHRHLPAVGPGEVNAQGQGMLNVGKRSQGMLEELEKAHIYIEQLHREITGLTNEVTTLKANKAELAALKSKVNQKDEQLETLNGEVTVLKEKEAQLEGLKSEISALKALVNQLMVQDRAPVPGEEG